MLIFCDGESWIWNDQKGVSGECEQHCAQTVKCPVLIVKRPKSTAAPAVGTSS
ncbi:unnamed protein product [Rhodiola kirilowii]